LVFLAFLWAFCFRLIFRLMVVLIQGCVCRPCVIFEGTGWSLPQEHVLNNVKTKWLAHRGFLRIVFSLDWQLSSLGLDWQI
jgi:hypothetical protein